jgi:hypothetical protein
VVSQEITMDDEFLLSGRRAPQADYARRLWERLDRMEAEHAVFPQRRPLLRAAAYAAVVLLAVGAFAFPSVRAGARAFLDLFRVVNFAPVAVQPQRDKMRDLDLPRMLGEQVEVLKAPEPRRTVSTIEAAGAAAGIRVRLPAWRPVGLEEQLIEVSGDHALRVTASASKLQQLVDAFGIDDVSVPDEIDGKQATVHVPAIVRVTYVNKERRVILVQARQPEVSFPAGLDLASLAEIGLRVLGVERTEARRFAQSVDWRTTLLVPVPADVAVFRQVDVQGNAGLLIQSARTNSRGVLPEGARLMWSSGDSVFALVGNIPSTELFEMAQSLQ